MIPEHAPPQTEAKTARKELKFHPSVLEVIKSAARSVGMDPSTFITTAAFDRAKEVERAHHMTLLPDDRFDAFAAAVDGAGQKNTALAKTIEKSRTLFADG